jgi:DeoR family glycerol-3-phosphate regulon repressor
MDNDGEIYDCFEDEIFLRRAMIKNAKTKVFLCDNTKVGKSSPYHLCSLKDIDYVASNLSLPNSVSPEKCLTL